MVIVLIKLIMQGLRTITE